METQFYYCFDCGHYMEWEDCWHCNGKGVIDEYEFDAINYYEGEAYRHCDQCVGLGGEFWCSNRNCDEDTARQQEPPFPLAIVANLDPLIYAARARGN